MKDEVEESDSMKFAPAGQGSTRCRSIDSGLMDGKDYKSSSAAQRGC